jgi:ATP-dependent RNA helicase HelY
VRVPKHFNHRSPKERRDLAATVQSLVASGEVSRRTGRAARGSGEDDELLALRHELRKHPCHACPDREEHARWAERRARIDKDTRALREKVESRTGSLARTFDKVCLLLTQRGYLTPDAEPGDAVTDAGRLLSRIWSEADLLVAECLRRGVWAQLGPAELAAVISVVVYEARRDVEEQSNVPRGPIGDAIEETLSVWRELATAEGEHGLSLSREPDLGFVWPIYRWARGESLAKVLASGVEAEMPAGDFVRWARQVVDLLGQIGQATADAQMRKHANAAIDTLLHGVLAYAVAP